MQNTYNLRFLISSWLWFDDSGQPMIWFIKHFDMFKFKSEEEAEAFIMTFAYIYSVFYFEGFIEKHTEEYLTIEDFLKLNNEDERLLQEQNNQEAIIQSHLEPTFIQLFKLFKSSRNLFREFVSMNIDKDVPSYTAHKYIQKKAVEFGFE